MKLNTTNKTLSATQVLPLIARSVRNRSLNIYQPAPLHTIPDDGLIFLLNKKRSIYVQHVVYAFYKDNKLYCPHLNINIEYDETNRTLIIEDNPYWVCYVSDVNTFLEEADLHFHIKALRDGINKQQELNSDKTNYKPTN